MNEIEALKRRLSELEIAYQYRINQLEYRVQRLEERTPGGMAKKLREQDELPF